MLAKNKRWDAVNKLELVDKFQFESAHANVLMPNFPNITIIFRNVCSDMNIKIQGRVYMRVQQLNSHDLKVQPKGDQIYLWNSWVSKALHLFQNGFRLVSKLFLEDQNWPVGFQ